MFERYVTEGKYLPDGSFKIDPYLRHIAAAGRNLASHFGEDLAVADLTLDRVTQYVRLRREAFAPRFPRHRGLTIWAVVQGSRHTVFLPDGRQQSYSEFGASASEIARLLGYAGRRDGMLTYGVGPPPDFAATKIDISPVQSEHRTESPATPDGWLSPVLPLGGP